MRTVSSLILYLVMLLSSSRQSTTLIVAGLCVDDFKYEGNFVCATVRSKSEIDRRNLCKQSSVIEEKCPVSCSVCCEDDPNLRYNGKPVCEVLSSLSDDKRDEYCEEFSQVSFHCPVTCNTCPLPFNEQCEWVPFGSDIIGEDFYSQSGESISISSDGMTLAVGAYCNTPVDPYRFCAGHVRVFMSLESSNDWVQMGSDIDGQFEEGYTGDAVSLSGDGLTVAVSTTGTTPAFVQVFIFDATTMEWIQLGKDLISNSNNDQFGYSVSLSTDGKILAIGAPDKDEFANNIGQVRVFSFDTDTSDWVKMGENIDGEAEEDNLGVYTHLSSDGKTVSISASRFFSANAVRVYSFDETELTWEKLGNDITSASNSWLAMSFSLTGNNVAVGDISGAGVAKVFSYDEISSDWVQMGSDVDEGQDFSFFGQAVSLSGDGMIMAVGAPRNVGSVNIYTYNETSMDWMPMGGQIEGEDYENFGRTLSISSDGEVLAVGAIDYDCSTGRVKVFKYVCD